MGKKNLRKMIFLRHQASQWRAHYLNRFKEVW